MGEERRVGELEDRVRLLEAELHRLGDLTEIKELRALYCYYADGGWGSGQSTDDWMTLFTEDAVLGIVDEDGSPLELRGREALRSWHKALPQHGLAPGQLTLWHVAVNPLIELDGDRARVRWHTTTPVVAAAPEAGITIGGLTDEDYERTPEGWRVARVDYQPGFFATLNESARPVLAR